MKKGYEKPGHKWYARIADKAKGTYKYFYSAAEFAAYKAGKAVDAVKKAPEVAKDKWDDVGKKYRHHVVQKEADDYKKRRARKKEDFEGIKAGPWKFPGPEPYYYLDKPSEGALWQRSLENSLNRSMGKPVYNRGLPSEKDLKAARKRAKKRKLRVKVEKLLKLR